MGRVGDLSQPKTVQQLALDCKRIFKIAGLRVIARDLSRPIQRVAVLGGSGGQFYPAALKAGADVYVTGDLSYHTGHDILAAGLTAIDPGHHIESICQPHLKEMFTKWNQENHWQIEVMSSDLSTDPFKFL